MEMWAVQEDNFFPVQIEQFMGISELADIFLFPPLFLILSLVSWIAASSTVLHIKVHAQTEPHDAVLCTVQWAALSAIKQAAL